MTCEILDLFIPLIATIGKVTLVLITLRVSRPAGRVSDFVFVGKMAPTAI